VSFVPTSGAQTYCSPKCRSVWRSKTIWSTANQYRFINGNWNRYFTRLCQPKERRGFITPTDCIAILDRQQGHCALTGEVMTCRLERGVSTPTNASLDRIDAGGPYTPENVQLVCAVINRWRGDIPVPEYVGWCRKVVAHAEKAEELPARV